ncbi:hypothetical protein [Serinicoccus hydrothermalis]|uniref:hypothetical protein n=1 Tax=Serinicoccus hydrothermalis TaxID=1758689 RepID=UPI0012F83476|nr:hypothetical protein [Serinicoccus hydrothermalis]
MSHLSPQIPQKDAGLGPVLVDLLPDAGNPLLRVAGMSEELSDVLGRRVDVVTTTLLRDAVSSTALSDAVAV